MSLGRRERISANRACLAAFSSRACFARSRASSCTSPACLASLARAAALSDRVAEYYTTPLGARSPHAGGWPLKTLTNLSELYVHYAYCADDRGAEARAPDHFAQQLSANTRRALYDAVFPMPYANLEDGHGRRKPTASPAHAHRGARRGAARRQASPLATAAGCPPPERPGRR
jgi:hypothetical protein